MGNCLKNVVVVVVVLLLLLLLLLFLLLLLLLRLLPLVVVVVLLFLLLIIIIVVAVVLLLLLLVVVDFEFHDVDNADLDVQHSDTHTLPFKPCCFFFRMDQLGSHSGAAPRQRVPHSCMSNSVASDVEGIIATVPGVEKCGPF